MMTRPDLNLDVDGVLADFHGTYLEAVHEVTGIRHPREAITRWDIAQCLCLSTDTTRAVTDRIKEQGRCLSIKPYPEALEGVRRLREIANVHIVTSPWDGPHWAGERIVWLRQHFGFGMSDITQTARKYPIPADLFVDDKSDAVDVWARHQSQGHGVIWSTPSNQQDLRPLARNIRRVTGWSELLDFVQAWRPLDR